MLNRKEIIFKRVNNFHYSINFALSNAVINNNDQQISYIIHREYVIL